MVAFDIGGGLPLAFARGAAVSALLSAFGTLVFRAAVLPKIAARAPQAAETARPLASLARGSLLAAAVLLPVWGLLQSADLADAGSDLRRALAAVPVVLESTQFGHVLLAQFLAVSAAAWAVRRHPRTALGLSAAALLLQAGHGHAWSMEGGPSLLLLAGALHLLAAGAWVGGLWPLLVVVRAMPPRVGALAARWFSPLGKACVAGMVLSSAVQFAGLVGGLPGLVGTAYGWTVGAKLGLLGVLFAFAVANRYRLAPALMRGAPEAARRRLLRAIAVQTGFGVLTVLAAGILSSLSPAVHEQPDWPFPLRPSLVAMADADLASEVWTGAAMLAGSAGALLALLWQPMRRRALSAGMLAMSGLLAWLAAPHLSLLLVEAYPTSYYTSPTGFTAASVVQGMALYPQHCARCHGAEGRGDGPDAVRLPVPPADLTAAHLWDHSDGEMFWWLLHGMEAPDGSQAMPGFAGVLSDEQRWALIDAVRARNAGLALRSGEWPQPTALPGFSLACPGAAKSWRDLRRDSLTTDDLRGRVLYLVAERPGAPPPNPAGAGVLPIVLTREEEPDRPACASADPAAWDALAAVTGQSPDKLAGSRVLVDANGWMRAFKAGPDAAAWDDPGAFAAAVKAIAAAPITATGGEGHRHH